MYIIDINSDEPIMLLNKQIGQSFNEDGTPDGEDFINATQFQEQLLQLDSLGKKRIQVWINSAGGSIVGGMNIFNAILKTKTPVDTYNVGICASIAGAIFMAGRKRIMADYAQFMMHPVSGGKEDKSLIAFSESVTKMLSAKSDFSAKAIENLMEQTTWMNASECLKKNICTEIEYTKDANKKGMPTNDATAMLAYSNLLITEKFNQQNNINQNHNHKKNTSTMIKVTTKLGLNDAATEENVVSAITEIENKAYLAETNLITKENELTKIVNASKKEKDELEKKIAEMEEDMENKKKAIEDLTAKYKAMCDEKNKAEEDAKENNAKNLIEGFANSGRIKNDTDTLSKWVNLAKNDFEGTKSLLADLPINKQAPTAHKAPATKANDYNVMSRVREIKNNRK